MQLILCNAVQMILQDTFYFVMKFKAKKENQLYTDIYLVPKMLVFSYKTINNNINNSTNNNSDTILGENDCSSNSGR